ncbi:MAG TPA: DMT family transporter [Propionibacteriaceae bacterium]|nr:DMT family transporter [Propionibacteriaceae bacterium]
MAGTVREIQQTKITVDGSDWRSLLAVAITVVAWASAFVVIRYAAHDISPGALSLGRLLVASLALSAMMLGRRLVRMSTREWALTALVGIAWFAVYSVALNAGEQHVDAGTASMLIQFAPILIGVLAGILLGEGFPRMLVIGGLVAFAGTLIIGFATSTGEADLAGVLLVLLSATVYSIAMVAQKVVLRRIPALQVTWLACLIGTVACLPFAGGLVRDLSVAPTPQILGVVYLGLVPTALAFSTWAYALSHTSAGKLGVTTFVVPPITILLAWLFLSEVPPMLAILGGALSLIGVAIARRPSGPRVSVPSGT